MPSKSENFKKYLNPVFIETGSFIGDGIQQALEAGFQKVISIELSEKYYNVCKERFKGDPRVFIHKGDSYKVLPVVISEINEKITFWLDGHHSCGDTALGDYWAPLIQELDAIKNHKIKDHTILIDDMRCWKEPNPVHGFSEIDIIKKLKEINIDYKTIFIDGGEPEDILVASI
jgi:hypothetical protein